MLQSDSICDEKEREVGRNARREMRRNKKVAFLKLSSDSRRAAWVMSPCNSVADAISARPKSILALCACFLVRKNTIALPF